MTRLSMAAAVTVACVCGAHVAATTTPTPISTTLPRTVLAIYDGTQATSPRTTPLHALLDMPLGHLGLVVRYHDIRRGLPPPEATAAVRGVVTWFAAESLPDPRAYLAWLEGLAAGNAGGRHTPLVVIGALGAFSDEKGRETPLEDINRVTRLFGWQFDAGWNSTTYGARYSKVDSRFVGFERPLPRGVPPYGRVSSAGPDAHVALRVEVPGRPASQSDLVIVGPRGAFVAPGYAYFSDESGDHEFRQWYVNPFELLREAFKTDALPKPDTTTVSGRRIFYSHVDGDGWRNVTQIEPYRARHVQTARVVLEEVVKKASDLPVSIGPIVGDIDPAWHGSVESLAVATALFAEPNVEAAIHTYSHPFDWQYFASAHAAGEEKAYGLDGDDAGGSDVLAVSGQRRPRMYDRLPFSIATEVDAAAAFVNRRLPPGKRVELLQWPGDTRPFEAVLARARALGLANINGGDTRFDREFPSAAWVAPLGIRVGNEWQVYASNSNENTYTDLWRDRFFGFSFLTRTVQNTGAPRRLKPFNLYYHMYSGERLPSLNAVLANIAYARTQVLAPIEASRFSRIADGFVTTAIEQTGATTWRVHRRGALQTIRFDGVGLAVDFERSRGVIGQRRDLGSLYVALDEQEATPTIALEPVRADAGGAADAAAYLVESRWRVFAVTAAGAEVRYRAQGYGPGEFVWHWPDANEVVVQWRARQGRTGTLRALPTADGLLTFRLPQLTAEPVDVRITTAGGGSGR